MEPTGAGEICARILAALPTWFGFPDSVADYVRAANENPTVVASVDGEDVGVLTLVAHSDYAAEIYVMGVLPDHHREGIGRAMLERAQAWLADHGFEFLQVKTLSARNDDPGYAKTRAFYSACGFRTLEEFPDLWRPDQPALQLIKGVPRR
jgi:GNAT superfamily N-acetyltransferase